MESLIDVPPGLNGVAVADTTIGAVHGDEGFYHYRQYDATELARTVGFEDAWHLLERGALPSTDERERFRAQIAATRALPPEMVPLVDAVASMASTPLARLRTVLSTIAPTLDLEPLLDLDEHQRREQARSLAAVVPTILAALHRRAVGEAIVPPTSVSTTRPHTCIRSRECCRMRPMPGRSSST